MSIQETSLKNILSNFAAGVTVVTIRDGEQIGGLTVSAFASVSMDPQLILISIDNESRSQQLLKNGAGFTVNILGRDQEEVSQKFARPGLSMEKRLEGVETRDSDTGGPILTNSIAWLECEQEADYWGGDHTLYLGRVVDGHLNREEEPLLYHRGSYKNVPVDSTED